MTDIYALYLPQFHQIPENDAWWGDGFTEWDNVRKARPLFRGHLQPLHPHEDNYYDLSNPQVLVDQADLARKFGVDGFVFFHYWSQSKLLLERPLEIWRNTPEANAGYALCWANHPWTRSWDGKDHQILWEQSYGAEADWDEHLEYLLPHFKDLRYKKIENRPLLFLYNAGDIPYLNEMVERWTHSLISQGFAGIHIVEYISTKNPKPACKFSLSVYEDEPLYSLRFEISMLGKLNRVFRKYFKLPEFQDYERTWKYLHEKTRVYNNRDIIRGAFVAWDNSPRRGKKGPMIMKGASPKRFSKHLNDLLETKRSTVSKEILVINAWNEWGEGAVLEPSREFGFGYLEAVKHAKENQRE